MHRLTKTLIPVAVLSLATVTGALTVTDRGPAPVTSVADTAGPNVASPSTTPATTTSGATAATAGLDLAETPTTEAPTPQTPAEPPAADTGSATTGGSGPSRPPSRPAAPPTTATGAVVVVSCPNGSRPTLDHRPTSEELVALCGLGTGRPSADPAPSGSLPEPPSPPPPTTTTSTTTLPLPRLRDVRWTNADGSPVGTFCVIPPDDSWRSMPNVDWCPPPGPASYRWTAYYDDGQSVSGVTPSLLPGESWDTRPNGWNGTISVRRRTDGSTGFQSGWD